MKLRQGITTGGEGGVMTPRAAAKMMKIKMMRSRFGGWGLGVGVGGWGLGVLDFVCSALQSILAAIDKLQGETYRGTGREGVHSPSRLGFVV